MREKAYKILTNTLSKVLRTPPYLIFFVSDECWTRCSHCWFNEEWKQCHIKSKPLSFDEIDRITDNLNKLLFLSITGGEAFLRDDILEVVDLFTKKKKAIRYQIPTSGYDTDMVVSKTERLLARNKNVPFRVDVSLDGLGETHDRIRNRKGVFTNAIKTILELNKIKNRCPYFDVGVITTISAENQNEIKGISEKVKEVHGEGEWMVNITRGKTRHEGTGKIDNSNYYKAQEIIGERIKDGSYKGHSGHISANLLSIKNTVRRDIIKDILEGKREGGGCSAGSIGGVIYSDGSVYPCEMLEEGFGNIRDFDYELGKLWNSSAAVRIRNNIQDTKCLCTQECFLSTNFLIQPGLWVKIFIEKYKQFSKE